jgi:hypothetical protein
VSDTTTEQPVEANAPAGRRRSTYVWPLVVVGVTVVYALVPYLLHEFFYQRGDTAAQFAPTWFHLGEMVRDGGYPPTLDPDAWQGGNYAAEALHGVYNPLNVLIWVFVSLMPDLMVATLLVKVALLVSLALGTYALAREYGCAEWAAAVVATALPFSGFTLYWEAGSWPSGLMAFAYTPWVWLVLRRVLRGVTNPVWAFGVGALAVTAGNPYGTLAVVAVGAALVVEGWLTRDPARGWSDVRRLLLTGVCIGAVVPLVFLPLLANSELAVRSTGDFIFNSGKMRPEIGDLFGLSSPTYVPGVQAITGPMQVPATYLAWFVLQLLPWLRWRVLRERARELSAVGIVGAAYLLATVGPSKVWLFRWPLRLIEYGWLAVLLLLGVMLSQGLERDQARRRAVASGALVVFTGFLTFSQDPDELKRFVLGLGLVAVGTAAVVFLHLSRRATGALLALVLVGGTGVTLAAQSAVIGENKSSRVWHVPSDVSALQETFAGYEGRTMQFADLKPLQNRGQVDKLERQWDAYLPGSMYQVAGVEAVNNYTGLGLRAFGSRFCMEYDGLSRRCGYEELWPERDNGLPPLADQMKLDTVVVQPRLAEGITPPAGWTTAVEKGNVLVYTRDDQVQWPESRLSVVPREAEVGAAESVGRAGERVEFTDTGRGGTVVFATLGWEGWSATFDGRDLPVRRTATGLLSVELPRGAEGVLELDYTTPGSRAGSALLVLGFLGALGLGLWDRRSRRAVPVTAGPAAPAAGRRRSSSRRPARRSRTGSPDGRTPRPEAPPTAPE